MIGLVAEAIEHHHRVGHRRENAAEPVLAIEPLGDKGHRLLDRPPARIRREKRLGDAQQPVEHAERHRRAARRSGR